VWDLQHYECIHQISAHDNSVTCLQFDDRRILSAGNDGKIKLWDIKQGRLIRSFTKPAKTVWKVQFTDTRAVVLMQRERSPGSEEGKTVMEVHNFDIATEPVIHIKEDENEDEELEQVIFSQEPTDMIVDTNL
jgi:F-box and WD-40 domain protein CDC4